MLFKRFSLLVLSIVAMVFAQEPASDASFKEAPLAAPSVEPKKDDNASTISVFVKNPEEIRALQDDLKNLQTVAGGSNASVDSLLKVYGDYR